MPRGNSGLLIASIDPGLKKQLYSRLAAEGQTYKDWLLQRVDRYLGQEQLTLSLPTATTQRTPPTSRPKKKRRSTSP